MEKNNQRELNSACERFEFYPIENVKLLKDLKASSGSICTLDDFGHFVEDEFARDQWRAVDQRRWKAAWACASLGKERSKSAGPEAPGCAG